MARQNRNVKFWAITASIAVHLIVLTAFAAVKFSPSQAIASQRPAATAKVTQMQKLIAPETIIPKPKIKLPDKRTTTKRGEEILPADKIFDLPAPALKNSSDSATLPVSTADISPLPASAMAQVTEFFGSRTTCRKVCYLVDCSGSMRGMFKKVQENLKISVQSLQPDQYFSIIFFGGDKFFEYRGGQLIRASEKNKTQAYDFIASVHPAGQTNALEALERALLVKDSLGNRPSVIYFLTDGFELGGENQDRLSYKISNLLKPVAFITKVNTIGFWTIKEDAKLLKMIAQTSGGEFVNITE